MTSPELNQPASPSSPPSTPTFQAPASSRLPRLGVRTPQTRSTSTSPDGPADSPSYVPAPDPVDNGPAGPTSTPSASERQTEFKIDSSVVEVISSGAVEALTSYAHQFLARTQAEREAGLWLADDADHKNIGVPLARFAERQAGPLAPNPDIADLIAAGLGLAAYAIKNGLKALGIRRAAKKLGDSLPDLVEHPDQPAAA
jgi:hypothetical protein